MPFTDSINLVDVVIADKELLSATPSDVAGGKMFIGSAQRLETGTIPVGSKKSDITLMNGETLNIPYGINPVAYNVNVQKIEDATIADAVNSDILEGKTAWANGAKVTGTMPNNGSENAELAAGSSHVISAGYHDGTGTIKAKDLLSQTKASVVAKDLKEGSTCWANGEFIEGTMKDNKTVSKTLTAGEAFTIPEGYHNGKGVIDTLSLPNQTPGTAYAGAIVNGYIAWVNGERIEGTMPANDDKEIVFPVNGEYTIPNGYHTGFGKIVQHVESKPAMTVAPAKETQVIPVKGFFMDGDITVTGIDALNYQRPAGAVHDPNGDEISNRVLDVVGNKASLTINVDNWHDNATLNVYKVVSNDMVDANGTTVVISTLIMVDYGDPIEQHFQVGSVQITTKLEEGTNAQIIEFNNITSGTVTVTEPFSARELNVKE